MNPSTTTSTVRGRTNIRNRLKDGIRTFSRTTECYLLIRHTAGRWGKIKGSVSWDSGTAPSGMTSLARKSSNASTNFFYGVAGNNTTALAGGIISFNTPTGSGPPQVYVAMYH